jgi:hypothetical protein
MTINSTRLFNGQRSFYAAIWIGPWRVFVAWSDTARILSRARQVDLWRGPNMNWYAGVWR